LIATRFGRNGGPNKLADAISDVRHLRRLEIGGFGCRVAPRLIGEAAKGDEELRAALRDPVLGLLDQLYGTLEATGVDRRRKLLGGLGIVLGEIGYHPLGTNRERELKPASRVSPAFVGAFLIGGGDRLPHGGTLFADEGAGHLRIDMRRGPFIALRGGNVFLYRLRGELRDAKAIEIVLLETQELAEAFLDQRRNGEVAVVEKPLDPAHHFGVGTDAQNPDTHLLGVLGWHRVSGSDLAGSELQQRPHLRTLVEGV
jgi:hypothetical protein